MTSATLCHPGAAAFRSCSTENARASTPLVSASLIRPPSKWREDLRLSTREHSRQVLHVSRSGKKRVTLRAALAKDQEPNSTPDSTKKVIKELKVALSRISPDSFSSLPGNLKAELKDAGFALSSGPVLLELGQGMGNLFLEMGKGLEDSQFSQFSSAAQDLIDSLDRGAAPRGTSEGAVVGRRVRECGRFLSAMGSSAPRDLVQLGSAMVALGNELCRESVEKKVDAAAVYGKRSFKVGSVEVQVTAYQAALGTFIAGIFGISTWRAVSALDSAIDGGTSYSSEGANLVASSLKQALLFSGYGTAALSFFACVGLGALAIQMASPPIDN